MCIFSLTTWAQQEAMFTQYMHNEIVVNPAYVGSHDVLSFTALHRQQWIGIDGAPVTQTLSAHTPLRNPKLATGLSIINDKIGVTRNITINHMYAYKLAFDKKKEHFLQFGLQGGFTYTCADYNDLLIRDENDLKFENQIREFLPNFGAGLYYYAQKFYVGISTPQLVQNRVELSSDIDIAFQQRHYFFTSGYVFDASPSLKIKPSVFVKMVGGAPVEIDVSTNFIIKEHYWLGFTYRSGDSFNVMALVEWSKQLRIGYAYDYTVTSLGNFSYGTHEIIVNYRLNFTKDRVITPRYF